MIENKATFFARLENKLSPSELAKVQGAYYLAKYGHRAQVRKETDNDGNPLRYFEHVRRVAIILMDECQQYDPDTICAALLHDALEDTDDINAQIIETFFGSNCARMVTILTKRNDDYVERLKSCSNNNVILIKACDRLDNLRSLDEASREFKVKQLKETRTKYMSLFVKLRDFKIVNIIDSLIYVLLEKYDIKASEICRD